MIGLGLCVFGRWREARPRPLGEPPLVPSLPFLAAGVLLTVLAGAHLVSLLTGVRLEGGFRP